MKPSGQLRVRLIEGIGAGIVRFQDGTNSVDDAAAAVLAVDRADLPCMTMLLFGGPASAKQLAAAAGMTRKTVFDDARTPRACRLYAPCGEWRVSAHRAYRTRARLDRENMGALAGPRGPVAGKLFNAPALRFCEFSTKGSRSARKAHNQASRLAGRPVIARRRNSSPRRPLTSR